MHTRGCYIFPMLFAPFFQVCFLNLIPFIPFHPLNTLKKTKVPCNGAFPSWIDEGNETKRNQPGILDIFVQKGGTKRSRSSLAGTRKGCAFGALRTHKGELTGWERRKQGSKEAGFFFWVQKGVQYIYSWHENPYAGNHNHKNKVPLRSFFFFLPWLVKEGCFLTVVFWCINFLQDGNIPLLFQRMH